jgi:hypothetical protein
MLEGLSSIPSTAERERERERERETMIKINSRLGTNGSCL